MEKQTSFPDQKEFTITQLLTFYQVSNEWIRNPENRDSELGKCILSVYPEIENKINPLKDLSIKSQSQMQELLVKLSNQHIIEQAQPAPGQPPQFVHKHIFNAKKFFFMKDSYSKYCDNVSKIAEKSTKERNTILNTKVLITPMFCDKLPSFKQFPESIQEPFIGIVIRDKKN